MTASLEVNQEPSLDSYIILPETKYHPDILVSQARTHQYKDWYQTHKALHQEHSFMLQPKEFIDFTLRLELERRLYDGNGKLINPNLRNSLLDDILAKREPDRAEWLDARFLEVDGMMYMLSNHRTVGEDLIHLRAEPFGRDINQSCYVDLSNFNRQGLPIKRSRNQEYKQGRNIYFCPPVIDSVAGSIAGSGGVRLGCLWIPLCSGAGLGVRQAKFREK